MLKTFTLKNINHLIFHKKTVMILCISIDFSLHIFIWVDLLELIIQRNVIVINKILITKHFQLLPSLKLSRIKKNVLISRHIDFWKKNFTVSHHRLDDHDGQESHDETHEDVSRRNICSRDNRLRFILIIVFQRKILNNIRINVERFSLVNILRDKITELFILFRLPEKIIEVLTHIGFRIVHLKAEAIEYLFYDLNRFLHCFRKKNPEIIDVVICLQILLDECVFDLPHREIEHLSRYWTQRQSFN